MLSLAARNSRQEVEHWYSVTFTNNLRALTGTLLVYEKSWSPLYISSGWDTLLVNNRVQGD